MFADLHLHTRFSDGTFTPEELAARAREMELDAVALTDHDTVDGCARMAAACAIHGLEFIPGTEFTAEMRGREFHILGYWLNLESASLLRQLTEFQSARSNRIQEMVQRLNQRGIPLTGESVFSLANCSSPGRPHVARALVEGGFCRSYDDAFEKYLKKGRPAWVPKTKMEVTVAVDLIHASGGAAVLAHPGLYRADEFLPALAATGLDGLECWHTKHTVDSSASYARVAEQLGLVATGGSDCHGMAKGEPLVGRIRLPYENVLALKARRPTPAAVAAT